MVHLVFEWFVTFADGTVMKVAPIDDGPKYLRCDMEIGWKDRIYNPRPIIEAEASRSFKEENRKKIDEVGGFGTYRDIPIKFDESLPLGSAPVYRDGLILVPTDFPDQMDVWLPLLSDFDEGTNDIQFITMDEFEDKMVQRMLHPNEDDEDEAPAF